MDKIYSIFQSEYNPTSTSARVAAQRWQTFTRTVMIPFMAVSGRGIRFDFEASDLSPDVSYMVVSNHQSQWDSFVELSAFNNAVAARLLPFRAMTYNKVLRGGLITQYLLGMGCFPSLPHETLPHGLDLSTKLLEARQTVFICPEGRRTLPGQTAPKPGVMVLAKLPNVMVVPAHIQWKKPNAIQKTFKLAFGKPFDGSGMTATEIMDRVYALELP